MGQFRVSDKTNEITAIPLLLKKIIVKGSVVTINAMGCQKDIVSEIVNQQADYLYCSKRESKIFGNSH